MKKLYKISILLLLVILIIGICVYVIRVNKTNKNEIASINNNSSNSNIEEDNNNIKNETNVSYVVLEIEDLEAEERNQQGLEYKNKKITDMSQIDLLMEIIDSATPYKEKSFISDFGDVPPSAKIYLSNGESYTVAAGDEYEDAGNVVNLMTKWYSKDGSNKTLYQVNAKLGEFIEKLANEENIQESKDIEKYSSLLNPDLDDIGDGTEGVLIGSNYKQYNINEKYTENDKRVLEAYKNPIIIKMGMINYSCLEQLEGKKTILDKDGNVLKRNEPTIEEILKYQNEEFNSNWNYYYYGLDEKDYKNLYFKLTGMTLMNGNNIDKESYNNYSRAKKVKITINNEKEKIINLLDSSEAQFIDLDYIQKTIDKPINIKVEVLETYKGNKYDDIYISDIQFGITSNIPQGR